MGKKRWTMQDVVDKNLSVTGGAGKLLDAPREPAKKKSKYNNKRFEADGILWDSQKEYNRWVDLKLLQRIGKISNLERQVAYHFITNGVKICSYKADFVYEKDGKTVVEDSKGFKTPLYRLKKKMMTAYFAVEIKET